MVHVPDDILMAFVDGELSSEERNWLEGVLAGDAALRRRLEPFAVTRAALPVLFEEPLKAPVPDRLIETIRSGGRSAAHGLTVGSNAPAARGKANGTPRRSIIDTFFPMGFGAPALGYAAMLMLGLSAGWFVKSATESSGNAPGQLISADGAGLFADGYLHKALDRQPSGKDLPVPGQSSNVRAVRTYRAADGGFCRQYQVRDASGRALDGFACREVSGKWRLTMNAAAPPADATAGGVATEASHGTDQGAVPSELKPTIARIGGEVTTVEEEAFLIEKGWTLNPESSPGEGNK